MNPSCLGKQVIWGNQFIVQRKKTLFFQEWIESGFIYVADLFKNGNFLNEIETFENLKK